MNNGYNLFQGDDKYNYITQDWWRDPSAGGGAIWNDYWGWQDQNTIKDLYGGQGASDQDFQNWTGLTKNMGQDWRQYADQLGFTPTWAELGASGVTGDGTRATGDVSFTNIYGADPIPEYTNDGMSGIGDETTKATTANLGDMVSDVYGSTQMPEDWNTASNVLSSFANTGNAVDIPEQWAQTTANANEMWNTGGMATDTSDAYLKAKAVADRNREDDIKQAMEQSGLRGNRWSSSALRTAADIGGKYSNELASTYAQQTLAAQEAARQRMLEANNQLYGAGTGYAGLDTDARNRALQATSQLTGLGK
jgi:hypothetical protein